MKTLHFQVRIQASRKAVWETMLERPTYGEWTAVFAPGSTYEGSWEKGAKIRFLAPNGEGITSEIAENRRHEFISIHHLGFVKDGVDRIAGPTETWAFSFENYSFKDVNGAMEVSVDIDTTAEYEKMLEELWPKALLELKRISERKAS